MPSFFTNIKINYKISLLGIGSVIITALALVSLAAWQSNQYNAIAQKDVDELINADLAHITQGVYNLVKTENQAVQQQVDYNMNVARHLLTKSGGVSLSDEKVSWMAENQFTRQTVQIQLSKMLIGDQWLGQNTNADQPTLVVDDIEDMVGDTATIFQRMNIKGDMLRVATTVQSENGERAIGTYIPAINPDGTSNPVIAVVLKGEHFHGRAYVVNDWYLTSYEPIQDQDGNLIGMLYVGVKLKVLEERVRQAILQTKVGETGYVFVLTGTGEDQGHYVISKDGLRDGEDLWNSTDYDGNLFIQEMIQKALQLEPGEMDFIQYPWQNSGETTPRQKISWFTYYEPWDWVIGTSAYQDELQKYKTVLTNGQKNMTRFMVLAGLLITLLVGLTGLFVAWSIAHPIQKMTQVVETIIQGDLDQVVKIDSKDEVGILAQAFNRLTSQQRETLKKLKNSGELFKSLIENSSDIITVFDKKGIILYQSPSIEKILGHQPEDVIGHSVFEFLHPDDYSPISEQINRLIQNNDPKTQIDFRFINHDGVYKVLEATAVNRLDDPSVEGIVANSRDITERKIAEAELQRVNTLMNTIIENNPDMIFLKDAKDLRFVELNQAGEDLLGCTRKELLGKTEFDLISKELAELRYQYDMTILHGKEIIDIPEERLPTRNRGVRTVHTKKVPIYDKNGNPEYLLGISEDITEYKNTDEELRRYREHLEEQVALRTSELSSANQELEAFNYSVSHDLRSHLRVMSGYSQILLEDKNNHLSATEKDYLNHIQTASQRMNELIEDLLKLSQINRYNINTTTINISQLIRSIADSYQSNYSERNVEFIIQEGLQVNADEGLLAIACENLIGNAWKFTSQVPRTKIEFGMLEKEGESVFFIRDNGIGFDMKQENKLFEPFQRLHSAEMFPGTGIGLSIVQRIIQRLGGRIWAEGKKDEGATFYFTLPMMNQI